MKEDASPLYPNQTVASRVTAYSSSCSLPLPPHISAYHAHIDTTRSDAYYMISNFQAQAHVFLARLVNAKRVLEIGVYVGYSSLVWAHAVGAEGKVTGLEFEEGYSELARDVMNQNGVSNVEILTGDALETLPALQPEEPYDLIFIDAQKSGYPAYLDTILENSRPGSKHRLLKPGGLILADNVLRRGIVADDSDENPHAVAARQTGGAEDQSEQQRNLEALRDFNVKACQHERLESWLMPLFDGMGMVRLKD